MSLVLSSLEGLRSEVGHDGSCFAAKMKHLFASGPGTTLTKDIGRPGVVKSAHNTWEAPGGKEHCDRHPSHALAKKIKHVYYVPPDQV